MSDEIHVVSSDAAVDIEDEKPTDRVLRILARTDLSLKCLGMC